MGRSRRSAPAARSAPPRAATPPRAAAPPPPAPTHVTVVRQPGAGMGGGGGMGMMGTMAATAGGVMAGNAISNHMMGGRDQPAEQPQPDQAQASAHQMGQVANPCQVQFEAYSKCMEANQGQPAACQWAWDMVSQCRVQNNV